MSLSCAFFFVPAPRSPVVNAARVVVATQRLHHSGGIAGFCLKSGAGTLRNFTTCGGEDPRNIARERADCIGNGITGDTLA